MARSIVGLFADRESAEAAVVDLKNAGFDPARIGIVMRDKQQTREVNKEHGTRSGETAMAGGIVGGTAGALLAATGALVIPGVGPFISGGILAAVLGAGAGALVGGLVGLGIPEEEAKYYQEQVEQGRALVTVDAQDRQDEAQAILVRNGAESPQGQHDDAPEPGLAQPGLSRPAAGTDQKLENAGEIRVPVRAEELVTGTRAVEAGRVQLHKEVVEQPQRVDVETQHERVSVDRVPLTGTSATADDAFVERDLEVPLMGEDVVVNKRVTGVEEVIIHKDVVTEQQQVTDSVRKERVIVDGVDDSGQAVVAPSGRTGTRS